MISWIQREFQHHFRTIFTVVLAATIISFVIAFNPSGGIGRAERTRVDRMYFGYNLGLPDDQARVFGDAALSIQLQSEYPAESTEIQNYGFQRTAALHFANQFHLPAATSQEVADFIKNLRRFAGADGQFDAKRYQAFRDSLKTNPRLNETEVARVISDDVRVDKVQKLLAGPGYVLPADIAAQLERSDSTWTLGLATADYASFSPAIATTDVELAKFFEENSFRYEIAPRVVVRYADFGAINYISAVTVTDAEVRAFYDTNPARFPKPPEVKPADAKAPDAKPGTPAEILAKADKDYFAVRSTVESTLKLERAQRLAAKAASDFSFNLYESKAQPGTPAFDAFLALNKIALKPLAPFTRAEGPAEFGGSPDVAAEAFKLSAARSYSDAVALPAGATVLFWSETQPARKPAFTEVKAKVATDYVDGEKRRKFVELGKTLKALVENRLKAGDSFEKAAAAAAGATSAKLDVKMFAPFTLKNPPQDLDYAALGALNRLQQGRVSDMVIAADKGLLVYAADKKLPVLSDANPAYVATRTQLASLAARIGASQQLSELVATELKRSEPKAQ